MNWWRKLVGGGGRGKCVAESTPATVLSTVPEAYATKVSRIDLDSITTVDAANTIGNNLLNAGNLEMATKIFEKGATLNPNHAGVVFNLAVAYRLGGKLQAAEMLCRKLLRLNPGDWDAANELEACQKREFDGSEEYETSRRAFLDLWSKQVTESTQTPVLEQAEQSGKDAAFREAFTSSIVGAMKTPDAKAAAEELLANTEFMDFRTDQAAKCEREALAGISLGSDIDPLVQELVQIGSTDGFLGQSGKKYDERGHHRRARQIGEMLNTKGGFSLMQAVGYRIQVLREIPRGLEHCWNGIGSWRA